MTAPAFAWRAPSRRGAKAHLIEAGAEAGLDGAVATVCGRRMTLAGSGPANPSDWDLFRCGAEPCPRCREHGKGAA